MQYPWLLQSRHCGSSHGHRYTGGCDPPGLEPESTTSPYTILAKFHNNNASPEPGGGIAEIGRIQAVLHDDLGDTMVTYMRGTA